MKQSVLPAEEDFCLGSLICYIATFPYLTRRAAHHNPNPPQRCWDAARGSFVSQHRCSRETSARSRTAASRPALGLASQRDCFGVFFKSCSPFCNATLLSITAIIIFLLLPLILAFIPHPHLHHSTAPPHSLTVSVSIFL